MSFITVIDDRNPSITYSPGWRPVTPAETSLHIVLNGTETATNTPGANATLVFNGAEISVFGSISSNATDSEENIPVPISAYSIDGGAPTIFTATASQNTKDRVTFFRATGLDLDFSHTLVITLQNTGSFFLDFIQLNSTRDSDFNKDPVVPSPNLQSALIPSAASTSIVTETLVSTLNLPTGAPTTVTISTGTTPPTRLSAALASLITETLVSTTDSPAEAPTTVTISTIITSPSNHSASTNNTADNPNSIVTGSVNSTRDFPAGVPTTVTISTTSTTSAFSGHSAVLISRGNIAGIVVGSLSFLCIMVAVLIYLVRRSRKKKAARKELHILETVKSHARVHTDIGPFIVVNGSQTDAPPPPYSSESHTSRKSTKGHETRIQKSESSE
ncbi:hypothetical protein CPC08DRAFT_713336 [Agrocybe pediades]|nr:hypothetical protein CPC08DRAFT_713336 [Agrocybe pediades]